jgi:hypothetical protein
MGRGLINAKKTEGRVIVIGDFNDDLNKNDGKINKKFDELSKKINTMRNYPNHLPSNESTSFVHC